MKLQKVIDYLEQWAPLKFQEDYDNSGLLVGSPTMEVQNLLFCLDSTEAVIDEAIEIGANVIIAHHPIVFSGLKSLTGKNYIERTILKAIKNDIAIYAIHTNLDNMYNGVNQELARRIGLEQTQILSPKKELLKKFVFFCPSADAEKVKAAIFEAGAGEIGEYDCCAFQVEGVGSFRAGEEAKPFLGKIGELHHEMELRIETVVPIHLVKTVINGMLSAHPYEEVAYDVYELAQPWNRVGSGILGQLPKKMKTKAFFDHLKQVLNVPCIRHTQFVNEEISKVAICGGSGSFLLENARSAGADILVTADFKYHQFFDAEEDIIIADVGHYESEQFTPNLLSRMVNKQFAGLSCHVTEVNTNPIQYY